MSIFLHYIKNYITGYTGKLFIHYIMGYKLTFCLLLYTNKNKYELYLRKPGRRSGLVVELRTLWSERSGVQSSFRSSCCILEQDIFTSPKSTGNTQEAVAPSRHD